MREYAVTRCECLACGHSWLGSFRIDREGDPDGSGKYGEWVNSDEECPECKSTELETDFTTWRAA